MVLATWMGASGASGCSQGRADPEVDQRYHDDPPQVVVVAPVLNMSDSTDWDPLRVTDVLASELQTFPGFVVIPVNRALAALSRMNRSAVETASDARELARELGADLTVVMAVTEYDPYDPPRVGLVLQCYSNERRRRNEASFDPVTASRQASEIAPASFADLSALPAIQVQAVFDASWTETLEQVRSYAAIRAGCESPHDWRIHTKSQELFVRFSCWSAIRSMRSEWIRYRSQSSVIEDHP